MNCEICRDVMIGSELLWDGVRRSYVHPSCLITESHTQHAQAERLTAEVARLTALHGEMRDVAARSAAAKFDAWSEVERLKALLGEFVSGYAPVGRWGCDFCEAMEDHTPDCLVTRARAALTGDDAQPR